MQEWRALSIEGQSKAAARAGGHVICWQPEPAAEGQGSAGDAPACGSLWLFGGRDALGAQVSYLLKLRPRSGGAWWVLPAPGWCLLAGLLQHAPPVQLGTPALSRVPVMHVKLGRCCRLLL